MTHVVNMHAVIMRDIHAIMITQKSEAKYMKRGDTTVRINEDRKLEIKRKILEIGNKTGDIPRSSEIISYLIDNYLDDAVKDMISKKMSDKKTKQ